MITVTEKEIYKNYCRAKQAEWAFLASDDQSLPDLRDDDVVTPECDGDCDDETYFSPDEKEELASDGSPSPKHYRDRDCTPRGPDPKDHQCEPGMTELGGWIICKHCGDNLKQIAP